MKIEQREIFHNNKLFSTEVDFPKKPRNHNLKLFVSYRYQFWSQFKFSLYKQSLEDLKASEIPQHFWCWLSRNWTKRKHFPVSMMTEYWQYNNFDCFLCMIVWPMKSQGEQKNRRERRFFIKIWFVSR